jgi:hypothetical protein
MPISYSWPVTQPAPPATTPTARAAGHRFEPLGCGIVRPFRRDVRGDIRNDCGVPVVAAAIGQILGTAQGELLWRPEFGSRLQRLRHKTNVKGLGELARVYVAEALERWEPRVTVVAVDMEVGGTGQETTLGIRVDYRIAANGRTESVLVRI